MSGAGAFSGRARGFTLLELLVSLVLFTLLATAVHQSLRAVGRAAEAAEAAVERGEALRAVAQFVERHVALALPVVVADAGRARLLFEGDERRLVLVTALPPLAGHAGPSEVLLKAPAIDSDGLRVSYRRLEPDAARRFGEGDFQNHPLAQTVGELRFAYYGASETRGAAAWQSEWRDRQRLPSLLRVSVVAASGESWPDIVVRLRHSDAVLLLRRAADGRAPARVVAAVDAAREPAGRAP